MFAGADLALPGLQEIEALVRRRDMLLGFKSPPNRLRRDEIEQKIDFEIRLAFDRAGAPAGRAPIAAAKVIAKPSQTEKSGYRAGTFAKIVNKG